MFEDIPDYPGEEIGYDRYDELRRRAWRKINTFDREAEKEGKISPANCCPDCTGGFARSALTKAIQIANWDLVCEALEMIERYLERVDKIERNLPTDLDQEYYEM